MSQSGSTTRTVGSLGSSTDSGGGSFTKGKDFANKQRKIIRILTVVAYIISVSTVALLLSAYYVFLWEPKPTQPITTRAGRRSSPTDSPTAYQYTNHRGYPYSRQTNSALHAVDPNSNYNNANTNANTKVSRKGYKPQNLNLMPTPQSLILDKILDLRSTTTPQRAPASPPDDPNAPPYSRTTPTSKLISNSGITEAAVKDEVTRVLLPTKEPKKYLSGG